MEFHFDCVFYYVSNLDAALQFYTKILGLKIASKNHVARLEIDGVLFELVPAPDDSKLDGNGNGRLCLKVGDISAAVVYLKSLGIDVGKIERVENGMVTSFKDPDRNEVSLWQYD